MCGFTTKLELFSKILFSPPAGEAGLRPASARKFCRNLRSKTEKFSFHLEKNRARAKTKKVWENFSDLEFREFGTAESGATA